MLAAQTNLTPDAALKELSAGNRRFAANQLTSVEHDSERTHCGQTRTVRGSAGVR
jgi:hypothetical protein